MIIRKRVTGCIATLAVLSVLLNGCASQGPVVGLYGDLSAVDKVAILPFQDMTALHGAGTSVRSPVSGRVFNTGPVANRSDRLMTDLVIGHVRQDTNFQIVPSRNASAIMDELVQKQGQAGNRLRLLAQTGRRLGADAVMVGHVYRFRERVGREFSAESPASVAFDIYLIDCRQNRVAWSAFYDYTQQALSDNLGGLRNFMRRGARWVAAEELATAAMESIFENFPQP